ncbi:MAG TPA: AEC family transporter [Anaerolineaceae bacterium]|nr:AEC family transporter [Anaerolineaceae bacterium]
MSNLVNAFINNLLPILLAAGVGALLGKFKLVQVESLSRIVLYVLTPCLVFNMLTKSPVSGATTLTMLGFTIALMVCVALLTGLIGFLLKWDSSLIAAAILTSMATNAGNYGLSLNKFAFGDSVLPYATLFMVANSMMTYTLGIVVASWGAHRKTNPLLAPFKYPFIYAFILALIFNYFKVGLPLPVDRVVSLFSDAAIPMMLLVLGLQLVNCPWRKLTLPMVATNMIRLLGSPSIALGLSVLFALSGPARQAGILQSAMPTAVTAILLATEFNLQVNFVTFAVAVTTVLSFITLTPLITLLS